MMLHDKIVPGQFLLDLKNDCTNSLYNGTQAQSKMDIYGAYNMHHHHSSHQQTQRLSSPPMDGEVLDLSRRCDSVETRKTPSPYNSISSFGTASPSTHCGSPPNSTQSTTPTPATITPAPVIPNGLVFSHAAVPPPLPQGIASLYPFYYANMKKEVESPPSPPAPVIANPLPVFPHSPVGILQKSLNRTTHLTYTGTQLEAQTCNSPPSLAAEPAANLYPNILNVATTGTINSSKTTRPFNAYPRDPALVAAHFDASDKYWEKNTSLGPYSTFRKRALSDLRDTNGGHRTITNPKMRRTNHRNGQNGECEERAMESSDNDSSNGNGSSAEHSNNKNDSNNNDCHDSSLNGSGGVKDEAYYERRRKNNAAAKKSRDRRRIKEDEIAIRAAYLERQNIELLCQVEALKKQLEIFSKA